MFEGRISAWFVFSLLLTSFSICGLKIHIGTRGTMLGYELAELKAKESALFHRRNHVEAKLSKIQNPEVLTAIMRRKSNASSPSLVMNK